MDIFSREMLFAGGGAWVRPNLTANGTFGGNAFAVNWEGSGDRTTAYLAVDNTMNTYTNIQRQGYFYFYNPKPLKVTQLGFTFRGSTYCLNGANSSSYFQVVGSNNNSSWSTISVSQYPTSQSDTTAILNNTQYYKYYRILLSPATRYIYMNDLQITAEEQ